MNFYISNYNNNAIMAVVAKRKEVVEHLLQCGYDIAYLIDNYVLFLPLNYKVVLNKEENKKLDALVDYDIIEINSLGIGYRLHSANEGDTTIVITPKCNSNCVMCPASDNERKSPPSNSLSGIMRFIDYLPSELYNLIITGGEPTLIKTDFINIMDKIKNKFEYTKVLLLTNGRSMSITDFFQQFLSVRTNNLRVAVPLHGHLAELHDRITQANESFNQTVHGITNLLNANIELEIRIVINKLNADFLVDIAKYIADNFQKVRVVNFVGLEVRGNCAKNANEVYIDYDIAFQKSKKAIGLLVETGIDVGIYNFPLCLIDKGYWSIAAKSIAGYKSMFYDECVNCDVKNACCGIFQATKAFIRPQVYPVKTKRCVQV